MKNVIDDRGTEIKLSCILNGQEVHSNFGANVELRIWNDEIKTTQLEVGVQEIDILDRFLGDI